MKKNVLVFFLIFCQNQILFAQEYLVFIQDSIYHSYTIYYNKSIDTIFYVDFPHNEVELFVCCEFDTIEGMAGIETYMNKYKNIEQNKFDSMESSYTKNFEELLYKKIKFENDKKRQKMSYIIAYKANIEFCDCINRIYEELNGHKNPYFGNTIIMLKRIKLLQRIYKKSIYSHVLKWHKKNYLKNN